MDTQVIHMFQRGPDHQGPLGQQQPNDGSNSNNGGDPRKKGISPLVVTLLIVGLVLVLGARYLFLPTQGPNINGQPVGEVAYSAFYQQVMNGNVVNAIIQGQDITGNFRNAIPLTDSNGNAVLTNHYHLTQLPNGDPNLITLLNKYHVEYQAKPVADNNFLLAALINFLPLILLFGVFFFIARRATQSQQNVFSFGKSRAKVVQRWQLARANTVKTRPASLTKK